MVKTRRKTITKLHEFEEKDFGEEPPEMKLPDIHLKSALNRTKLIEKPKA